MNDLIEYCTRYVIIATQYYRQFKLHDAHVDAYYEHCHDEYYTNMATQTYLEQLEQEQVSEYKAFQYVPTDWDDEIPF